MFFHLKFDLRKLLPALLLQYSSIVFKIIVSGSQNSPGVFRTIVRAEIFQEGDEHIALRLPELDFEITLSHIPYPKNSANRAFPVCEGSLKRFRRCSNGFFPS